MAFTTGSLPGGQRRKLVFPKKHQDLVLNHSRMMEMTLWVPLGQMKCGLSSSAEDHKPALFLSMAEPAFQISVPKEACETRHPPRAGCVRRGSVSTKGPAWWVGVALAGSLICCPVVEWLCLCGDSPEAELELTCRTALRH